MDLTVHSSWGIIVPFPNLISEPFTDTASLVFFPIILKICLVAMLGFIYPPLVRLVHNSAQ